MVKRPVQIVLQIHFGEIVHTANRVLKIHILNVEEQLLRQSVKVRTILQRADLILDVAVNEIKDIRKTSAQMLQCH